MTAGCDDDVPLPAAALHPAVNEGSAGTSFFLFSDLPRRMVSCDTLDPLLLLI